MLASGATPCPGIKEAEVKEKMMSCGFTLAEAEQLARLDPAVLQKIIALVRQYGLPAFRAALPFILAGDWLGALEAVLKVLLPSPA